MGSCSRKGEDIYEPIASYDRLKYYRQAKLKVRRAANFSAPKETLHLALNPPERVQAGQVIQNGQTYTVSSCTLGGQDPFGRFVKECQDSFLMAETSECILAGIYDGHGKFGREVVDFCTNFVKDDFLHNPEEFAESSPIYLNSVTQRCDQALLGHKDIDVTLSGTTQILALIREGNLYIANVGDSRAILATKQSRQETLQALNNSRLQPLKSIKQKRSLPEAELNIVKMTKEHVPDDQTEADRIKLCGGRIKQMSDKGEKFGPFRVWCKNSNKPGLAMTRSIGDSVASEVGVISFPTIQSHEIDESEDQFVVLATDGIWDVMDLNEVANFVQAYRGHCLKNADSPPEEPKCANSCIAHLLCEEARLRWVKLIENEGVVVDDICCVVIEFNQCSGSEVKQMLRVKEPTKLPVRLNSLQSSELIDKEQFLMRDPFRSSCVDEEDLK